jgi:hypothetical protein
MLSPTVNSLQALTCTQLPAANKGTDIKTINGNEVCHTRNHLCSMYVFSAVSCQRFELHPSQHIMNFELISILLYKADNSQIASSPPHLSALRTQAEYKPLNSVLVAVRMNQNVQYKDDNFTSVYIFRFYSITLTY